MSQGNPTCRTSHAVGLTEFGEWRVTSGRLFHVCLWGCYKETASVEFRLNSAFDVEFSINTCIGKSVNTWRFESWAVSTLQYRALFMSVVLSVASALYVLYFDVTVVLKFFYIVYLIEVFYILNSSLLSNVTVLLMG